MSKRKRNRIVILLLGILVFGSPVIARLAMHVSARGRIYADIERIPECRVAVVLGAGVYPDGTLSTLLRDRVDAGIALYEAGKVEKLLMSGDNSVTHYNEPQRMMEYALKHGVPAEDVAMDFAGRRTYDSIYRAKRIFGQDEIIVVSQRFHLDRAVFLCDRLGVRGYGFAADQPHHDNPMAAIREIPACLSAVLDVYLLHPTPILGKREKI